MKKLLNDYGMVLVLIVISAVLSVLTYQEQPSVGKAGAERFAKEIQAEYQSGDAVLIVTGAHQEDLEYSNELARQLKAAGFKVLKEVNGTPQAARKALAEVASSKTSLALIAGTSVTATKWRVFEGIDEDFPDLGNPPVIGPSPYKWPTFLKLGNLMNIPSQVAVYAILAIGMTMVIITGGIDLSVGSLIALSAVITAWLIQHQFGGAQAGVMGLALAGLGGILACGASGLFTGLMVTVFRVPPFIVTLAMMMVASGLALILSNGESISGFPESFRWLGAGKIGGVPVSVCLMLLLYVLAHLLMSRSRLGRQIYAVGGNREAARLSGIPVNRVLLMVYVGAGLLAGLGGVIVASELNSGDPKFGNMAELYVIAAVVVGGTSLMGGEGKMFGTLIGALIIGVIQNGMNIMSVQPYMQKVVLGLVVLGAVLFDKVKQNGWSLRSN